MDGDIYGTIHVPSVRWQRNCVEFNMTQKEQRTMARNGEWLLEISKKPNEFVYVYIDSGNYAMGYAVSPDKWNEMMQELGYVKLQECLSPPFHEFKGAICRGSFALGTACGTCEKCRWEKQLFFRLDAPAVHSEPWET